MLAIIARSDEGANARGAARSMTSRFGRLLLLHGLHPEDMKTRVRRAVERAAPHLGGARPAPHLVEIAGGQVRLRLRQRRRHDPEAAAVGRCRARSRTRSSRRRRMPSISSIEGLDRFDGGAAVDRHRCRDQWPRGRSVRAHGRDVDGPAIGSRQLRRFVQPPRRGRKPNIASCAHRRSRRAIPISSSRRSTACICACRGCALLLRKP